MTEIRYRPGDWRAAVTPQGVALLPATMEADMLGRVWTSLQAGHGLGAVLESLTGAFGTSLRAIPPFAVITFGGGEVRLAVRGPIDIDVVEADAAYGVSGAEVTTWSERVVRNPTSLVVRTDTPAAEGSYGITDGIVLCAELTVAFAPASSSASPLTPSATPIPTSSAPAPTASAPAPSARPSRDAPTPPPASGHDVRENRGYGAKTDHSPQVAGASAPEVAPAAPEETIVPPEHTVADVPADPEIRQIRPENADREAESDGSGGGDGGAAEEEVEYTQAELPDDAYDHLWGATVVKSVEHAAVRELDDADEPEEPARASATPAESAPASPGSDGIAPATDFAPPAGPAAAPDPQHWTAPPLTGLIDSVPGFGGVGAASSSPTWSDGSGPDAPSASGAAPTAAVARTATAAPPSSAAPTTPVAVTTAAVPPAAPGDDHDGLTVTVSELEAIRRLAAADADADGAGTPAAPDAGAGRLILSTGETHPLDRPIIIGRRPRANRVQADQVPLLVTVASPEQDISRNHLEVRIEGRHVLAADLDTTNGSVLHREGTPPLRLAPNEPVLLLSGDVIDLGDGITVLFEDLP
jgi:hypothetical protein